MAFRTRPVLDRRRRTRWQDELRTQRFVVAGFALAIAIALGIFGATAWNSYWEGHLRPVAHVEGISFDREDLTGRQRVLTAELTAEAIDLQSQLGGPRDPIIEQRLQELSSQLSSVTQDAATSLVQGAVLRTLDGEPQLSVSDEEIDAEIAERQQLPERLRLSLILVAAEPEATPSPSPSASPSATGSPSPTASPNATSDASPAPTESPESSESPEAAEPPDATESPDATDEADFERAEEEAAAALARIEGGEDFATVASEVSDDFTAGAGGSLGLVEADDPSYAEYYEAAADGDQGEVVGPFRTERGYALVRVDERVAAAEDEGLRTQLAALGVSEQAYRAYIRDELLLQAARAYFEEHVATSRQPQRLVAQIKIAAETGTPVPQERARHILVQPLPGEQDQSAATDEQWAAALAEAEEVHELVSAADADWFAIAEEHSEDPGSSGRGGDLGWYDPAAPGFVPEFAEALAALDVGEISEPVRSDFGYHVIQLTGERTSAAEQAEQVAAELREEPDSFAEVAERVSEDPVTAEQGGELGWVARYQLDPALEEAVFSLDEGEISDVVEVPGDGYYILRVLEVADSREIEEDRLQRIRENGFSRWLEELREPVEVWVDPQFASSDLAAS